jgi:LPS sulfotransferase NodH
MATDSNRILHNIISKAALLYGSKTWIKNARDVQQMEAAQTRFLRALFRPTDKETYNIRNITKIYNMIEDLKTQQKSWSDYLQRLNTNRTTKIGSSPLT